ncbi:MAG: spore protease YyaC [Tepidanaerobacteraceae bacterium]|jgi:putative sporulation protein YyaC|nr:spore protease YyaC [Tepidanaerobacteraceae bacterium]
MLFENPLTKPRDFRVHIEAPYAADIFSEYFFRMLGECFIHSPVIILCIGTDRSTGDSLGPLVGDKLKKSCNHARVLGTLSEPVHAGNLSKVLEELNKSYADPFIIAVDASLGCSENVGTIKLAKGSIKPGAGVNKDLPPVGDFHITGIVNVGGFMEYFVLQNTRLYVVMKMAEIISEGINKGLTRFFG